MTIPQRSGPAAERSVPEIAELYELTRRRLFPKGLWGLFYAHRTADELQFGGFAIPPLGLEIEHRFAVNGVEILAVLEATMSAHQDLVVMRRR